MVGSGGVDASSPVPRRIEAAAAADADRVTSPAVLLLDPSGAIEAIGHPEAIGPTEARETLRLPGSVVLPGLVNAHAHLDLTALGTRPFDANAGFSAWAAMIRRDRPSDPEAIAESVRLGVEASRRGGTAIVGDIAGNRGLPAFEALRSAGVRGVSYIEVFGIGRAEPAGCEFVERLAHHADPRTPTRLVISPHASYSCGDRLYEFATSRGLPVATHLAETLEELEFSRSGAGPLADLLRAVGAWNDALSGWNRSPIARLAATLEPSGAAIAHGNYLDDRDVELLAEANARAAKPIGLVYCPRASAYFGHPAPGHAPHRYRELLERGVPVALGTDSIVCLDTPQRLSTFDEMRLLRRRDAAEVRELLAMATVHGAALLGEPRASVTLGAGDRPEGLLSVEIAETSRPAVGDALGWLVAAIEVGAMPEWIVPPTWCRPR